MTVEIHKRVRYSVCQSECPDVSEFELTGRPVNETVRICKLPNGGWVIGYLQLDDCCVNPLKDCDGMGHIRSLNRKHVNSISREEALDILETNPLAVVLSYYEHGNCLWDVRNGNRYAQCPDRQWDGVEFAGVWFPDKACEEHIRETARDQAGKKADHKKLKKAMYEVARTCAGEACETYTAWCNGECYGVSIEKFDDEGNRTDEESCWGYIATKWAEEERNSKLAEAVEIGINQNEGGHEQ